MGINRAVIGRALAATAVIASTVLLGMPSTASAAPGEGSISGTVRDDKGNPLEGICVSVENVTGSATDANGDYSFSNIPAGQHRLQFSDCRATRVFLTQWYLGARDEAGASWVDVFDQANTALSDVYMVPGVSVEGIVTDMGGNPVEGVRVRLDPQGPYNSNSGLTDASGHYRTGPVEDGQYRVEFSDDQYPARYAKEYWNDQYIQKDAQNLNLQVSNGTTTSGIDAQLATGATISGHVQDQSGSGIEQICVSAETPGWDSSQVAGAQTDANGDYSLHGLPPLSVVVRFNDCGDPRQYVDQFYNGASDPNNAQQLALNPGATMGNIDATLELGAIVSGTVTDGGGNPVPNVSVAFDSADRSVHGWGWTDASGRYSTSPLPPGDYRVQFNSNDDTYAIQYWNGQPTWDSANVLSIKDNSPIGGIDARLAAGARITGKVTRPDGSPAANICIGSAYGTSDNFSTVAWDTTDASGNYELKQLPAGSHRVRFEDCNDTGPYLGQWYDAAAGFDSANTIDLAAGENRGGIDARMQPAAQIKGTVTDTSATPLPGICVQATTDSFLGDMTRTGADGGYSLKLAKAGQYKVQFVDCGDPEHAPYDPGGTYLGKWWGGGLEPATAKKVAVATGATVKNIDAALAVAGGTGTVAGRVTNVRGEPLKACIALYLPSDSVRFAMTDVNGKYSFSDVPTGTWTIGFLGCGSDDVSPVIPDAGSTGVFFNAMWYDGVPLQISQDAPDPIAQGATLVTIGPDESIEADMCFGCGSVEVKPPVIGDDYILVDFDTTGLAAGGDQKAGASAALTYSVECESPSGTSTSASQDSYPVKVSGFTPGAPYVCSARILSNGFDVADSTTFEVTVGKATPATPSDNGSGEVPSSGTPTPSGDPTTPSGAASAPTGSDPAGATPAKLAYTGGSIAAILTLGAFMILMGIGFVMTTMRMRSDQPRRRATS